MSLQPRYRRLFTFGDVLDESVRLYRAHWVPFALVSAISLLPPGLILVGVSAAGLLTTSFNLADLQTGRLNNPDFLSNQINALIAVGGVSILFSIVWTDGNNDTCGELLLPPYFHRHIRELHAAGLAPQQIVEELNGRGWRTDRGNPWSLPTVQQIVRTPPAARRKRCQKAAS